MNRLSILLFFTIIPIILILIYVNHKDKNKEPILLLLELFALGIFSCYLVIHISDFLLNYIPFMNPARRQGFINILLYSFIGVALIEESLKWLVLYMRGYYQKEYDEDYDMIVYAVFVSLGFAFLENAFYIQQLGNLRTAITRALLAIPGHACDAIFMGYYLSLAKQFHYSKQKGQEIKYTILSILIPAVLHGIYDFCILSKLKLLVYIFFIFVIFLYIISIKKLKEISKINKLKIYQDVFCPICGAKLQDKKCPNCNKQV